MENHRIKVKLGDAEFDAEGNAEVVQAQYDAFLAAVAALPKPAPKPAVASAFIVEAGDRLVATAEVRPHPATLERVFRNGDVLSLAALPTGEKALSDAMLVLLYGYNRIKNESSVTGTALARSAKVSGISFGRLDRVMGQVSEYVLAAGIRKARRYQLNNRGIARAEEIIKAIVQ